MPTKGHGKSLSDCSIKQISQVGGYMEQISVILSQATATEVGDVDDLCEINDIVERCSKAVAWLKERRDQYRDRTPKVCHLYLIHAFFP